MIFLWYQVSSVNGSQPDKYYLSEKIYLHFRRERFLGMALISQKSTKTIMLFCGSNQ